MLVSCKSSELAKIDDVTRDVTYQVKFVDGLSPTRVKSSIITAVPYVLLSPGRHIITIQDRFKPADFIYVEAVLEPNRTYRIIRVNNYYILIPDNS